MTCKAVRRALCGVALKSTHFYVAIIVSAVLAGFTMVMTRCLPEYTNMPDGSTSVGLFSMLGIGMFFLPFIAAITLALFIDPEFTHGTIRNKLVCGHSRTAIYFAAFMTEAAAMTIVFVLYAALTLIVSLLIGIGELQSSVGVAAAVILIRYVQMLAVTSMAHLLCTLVHGVKCVVFSLGLQYVLTLIGVFSMIEGAGSNATAFTKFVNYLLPQSAGMSLPMYIDHAANDLPENLYLYYICPLGVFAAMLAIGLLGLYKSDLK